MNIQIENENPILAAALDYHRRGWCVIPIPYGSKEAQISWKKFQTQRPDDNQIRKWFSGKKPINIGILTGPISDGMTVIDFDSDSGYKKWACANPDLAKSIPTVKTSRGWHIYCNTACTKTKKVDDIDIKASGYVLAPPSKHPNGTIYEWTNRLDGELVTLNLDQWHRSHFTQEPQEPQETYDTQDTQRDTGYTGDSSSIECEESKLMKFFGVNTCKKIMIGIKETLPIKIAQRNKKIFILCVYLQGIPELANLPDKDLEPIVRAWHKLALPAISTKNFEFTWIDFINARPEVKYPRGSGELGTALSRAQEAIENGQIRPEAKQYEAIEIQLLVQVCFELQKITGDNTFFLDYRKAGKIIGQSHVTAGNILKQFIKDGILKEIEKGGIIKVIGPDGKPNFEKKASTYRYLKG